MTFLTGRPPRVIAHRGLALDAPENTLLAFLRALSAGATHLETDIHVSADDVAVIAHDPGLGRVARRDVQVSQLTMPELRRIELEPVHVFGDHPHVVQPTLAGARFDVFALRA